MGEGSRAIEGSPLEAFGKGIGVTTLVLHVGMTKTGTSTIQQHMARAGAELRAEGLLYPEAGRLPGKTSHHGFCYAAIDPEARGLVRDRPGVSDLPSFARLCAAIEGEMAAASPRATVLSCEMFWTPAVFPVRALERVRDAFPACDIRILAYLRSVSSHAVSGYAQRIKGPQKFGGSFAEHLRHQDSRGVWRQADRLAEFQQVFGADAVLACWYDEVKTDIWAPIARALEAPHLDRIVGYERRASANVTPDWDVLERMRRANRARAVAVAAPGAAVSAALAPARPSPADAAAISPAERAYLDQVERRERAAVEARFQTAWWR